MKIRFWKQIRNSCINSTDFHRSHSLPLWRLKLWDTTPKWSLYCLWILLSENRMTPFELWTGIPQRSSKPYNTLPDFPKRNWTVENQAQSVHRIQSSSGFKCMMLMKFSCLTITTTVYNQMYKQKLSLSHMSNPRNVDFVLMIWNSCTNSASYWRLKDTVHQYILYYILSMN